MNTLMIKDIPQTQELSADDARNIVGGNPVILGAIAGAVVAYISKKAIDAVVKETGILDPVISVTDNGISVGGKKL